MANNIYIILSGDKGPETLRQILKDLTASNTAAGVESPRLEAEQSPALEIAKEPQPLEPQGLEPQPLEPQGPDPQNMQQECPYKFLRQASFNILAYVNRRGGGPVNAYDVSAALNKNIVAVRGNLRDLANYGLLERLARGVYILTRAGREVIRK